MKAIIILSMYCLLWLSVIAQAPPAFKYQAVARNTSGEVLANQLVSFRISIIKGTVTGAIVYTETHKKSTNAFGLVDLEIGKGNPGTGIFSDITWSNDAYFLNVEMDPSAGTAYLFLGASQLLSVPYALCARDVENNADGDADQTNEIQVMNLSGTVLSLSKGGGTVNLPSSGGGDNWGTQTVVTDATITGSGTTATPLKISDNGITSAKIQNGAIITEKLANGSVTGTKIAQASATSGQVLKWDGITWTPADDVTGGAGLTLPFAESVSAMNAAFQVTNSGGGEGIIAISASVSKTGVVGEAPNQGVLGNATASSGTAYGVQGTSASSTGSGVTGFGSSTSGKNFGVRGITASGSGTAIYGLATATSGTTYGVWGESNAAAGWGVYGKGPSGGVYGISPDYSGYGVLGESTADAGWGVYGKGKIALYGNSIYTDGRGVVGSATGSGLTYGVYGSSTSSEGIGLYGSNTSSSGTTKGVYGRSGSSSGYGVYGEGKTALYGTTSYSTGYGVQAECTSTSGYTRGVSSTVYSSDGFSGYFAGGKFVVTSSKVGIGTVLPNYQLDVTGTANLINGTSGVALRCNASEAIWYNGTYYSWGYGGNYNFFADEVKIGGSGDIAPAFSLEVNGSAGKTGGGSWSTISDLRLKDLQGIYCKGLNEIVKLQPVLFTYKENNPRHLPSDIREVGFVAQEVQKIFPEAVSEGKDGYLNFNMHAINVAMVNAIRELKAENDRLKAENEAVVRRILRLEKLVGASAQK